MLYYLNLQSSSHWIHDMLCNLSQLYTCMYITCTSSIFHIHVYIYQTTKCSICLSTYSMISRSTKRSWEAELVIKLPIQGVNNINPFLFHWLIYRVFNLHQHLFNDLTQHQTVLGSRTCDGMVTWTRMGSHVTRW